jgi:hypothetical protein
MLVEEEVCRFEEEHGFQERWTTSSKAYNDALILTTERRYRRAVDILERLVVQRLLELTKLSMSGVGASKIKLRIPCFVNQFCPAYKLRDKIGKALKSRADAIHHALKAYNAAAAALVPPRQQLVWAEVIKTTTLAEFDLLRDTRSDIRQLPWAQPERREAGRLYFGIKRVLEEIRRLNIEITRIITFSIDEHVDFHRAIGTNCVTRPHVARELSERWQYKSRIYESIAQCFVKTSRLPGFSGTLFPGEHVERDPAINADYPLPPWAALTLGLSQVVGQYEEEDDTEDRPRELAGLDGENIIQLMDRLDINGFEEFV